MNSRKDRTHNFHPYHCEVKAHSKGFTLIFYAPFEKRNDYTRRQVIKLHFETWWLGPIATMIKTVLKYQTDELRKLKLRVGLRDED